MTVFEELETQYYEIDQKYSIEVFKSQRRRWAKKGKRFQRKREINDEAYFLFIFSRLEDIIRVECAKLIKKKQDSNASWKQRSPWEIFPNDPSSDEMKFKHRLTLLAEKGGSDFNLVIEYYKERNSIAHGGNFTKPISMPTVIIEMKRLYKVLKIRT